MKIYGKKYLINNSYHQIVIKIVNCEYVINVSGSVDSFCLADDVDSDFIKDIVQDSNKRFIKEQLQLNL